MADGQRPPRTRTIRVTLVGLLLVPLLALVGLWAFAASITLGNVIRYQHYTTLAHATSASIGALTGDLAAERSLTLAWEGSGRRIPQTSLLAARHATDTAAAASRTALASTRGLYDPVALSGLNRFLADLASLPRIRAAADSGAAGVVTTYRAYDKISTALREFFHISAPPSDATLSTMSQSAVAVVGLGDSSFGAVSLIEAALAAGGQMTQPERTLFAQVVGQQNLLLEDTFTLSNAIRPGRVRTRLRIAGLPAAPGDGKQDREQPGQPADPGQSAGLPGHRRGDGGGGAGPAEPGRHHPQRPVREPRRQPGDPAGPGRRSRPARGRRVGVPHGAVRPQHPA